MKFAPGFKKLLIGCILALLTTSLITITGAHSQQPTLPSADPSPTTTTPTPSPSPSVTVSPSPTPTVTPTPRSLGVPVVLGNETLFNLHNGSGDLSPEERAKTVATTLEKIANDQSLSLDTLRTQERDTETDIYLDNQLIITLTDADAQGGQKSRPELAREYLTTMQNAIQRYREERSLNGLIWSGGYALGTTIGFLLILWLIGRFCQKIQTRLEQRQSQGILGFKIKDQEMISGQSISKVAKGTLLSLRWLLGLPLAYLYLALLLSFFPWTKPLGLNLLNFVLPVLLEVGGKVLDYIPNLLILIFIGFFAYFTIRLLAKLSGHLEAQRLTFEGFYPEWAKPTFYILTILVIIVALALAIPYLPGINFLSLAGLLLFFSLWGWWGLRDTVADFIAGFALTYTRAFVTGDRVKIGDFEGLIVERNPLITRIRTPKNEVISIPNYVLLRTPIINYSLSLRDRKIPLILHTTIAISYDVPWSTVQDVLIKAAHKTRYILREPSSFVLQKKLNAFAIAYELNAYTNAPSLMERIYSELHQNIQDGCNEAGIELLTPQYSAIRDGNHLTIPDSYLASNYTPPALRIVALGEGDRAKNPNPKSKKAPGEDVKK